MSKDTSLNTSLLSELSASFVKGTSDSSLVDLEDLMLCDIPTYLTSEGSTPQKIMYNGQLVDSSVAYYKAEEIIDRILATPQLTITGGIDWLENNDYVKPANRYQNEDKEFHIASKYTGIKDNAYVDREIEDDTNQNNGSSSIGTGNDDGYDPDDNDGGCQSAIIEFAAETGDVPAEEYNIFVKPGDSIDERTIIGECIQDGKMKPIRSIFSKGTVREDLDDGGFGRLYKTVASRHIIVDCYEQAEGKNEDGIDMKDLNEDPEAFAKLQNSLEKSEESMKLLLDFFPYLMYLRLVDSVADANLEENDDYWYGKTKEEGEAEEETTYNPDKDTIGEVDFGEYDATKYIEYFIGIYSKYIVDIPSTSVTYAYLETLLKEAWEQFYNSTSLNGIPFLYDKKNFPNIVDYYGKTENKEWGFKACCGWLVAMALAELLPNKRNSLFKIGYNLGGDKTTPIYKYEFHSDPNIARLVASGIWAALRLKLRREFAATTTSEEKDMMKVMRAEVDGQTYPRSAQAVFDYNEDHDAWEAYKDELFVDVTIMFPTAPGPYDSRYDDRSKVGGRPYPSYSVGNGFTQEYNLTVDQEIYEYIVANYNLDQEDPEKYQRTVQAIADKESRPVHLFGDQITSDIYTFNPVFGIHNIGKRIDPNGYINPFMHTAMTLSSLNRTGLLDGDYFGRRRPGQKNNGGVGKDGKEGILCNYYIEEFDGHPANYDESGRLKEDAILDPDDYCDYYKNELYSNSYPSGHSAGIWGVTLSLVEMMPDKADKIMAAGNTYAVNRTVARYHWNSDTIVGRVIASSFVPIMHAMKDYDDRIQEVIEELNT